jgi:hypothetical protein
MHGKTKAHANWHIHAADQEKLMVIVGVMLRLPKTLNYDKCQPLCKK